MTSISLGELTSDGVDFFQRLPAGEAYAVTDAGRTVALLIGVGSPKSAEPRQAGVYAGQITIAPGFNEPLPEWEEAMERPIL